MNVAVDTSVLVGLLVPNDHWHEQAVTLWKALEAQGHTFIYLDCVTTESISVILRHLEEKGLAQEVMPAIETWLAHVSQEIISWAFPEAPHLYMEIVELMRSSSGALNFNDALLALACRERGIEAVASFDADFDQVDWLRRLAKPSDLEKV